MKKKFHNKSPEHLNRLKIIDKLLLESDWDVDTKNITFENGYRPKKNRNIAISEYPTKSGPADYVLFKGLKPIAVIEAKKIEKDISSDLQQAKRYSLDFVNENNFQLFDKNNKYKIPFLFSTNGRQFTESLPTTSGIWFCNIHSKTLSRPIKGFYTPEKLENLYYYDNNQPTFNDDEFPTLRDYQNKSINYINNAINNGKRECLLALATGTGKTIISIFLIHHFLKNSKFKRILFVVDRKSLAKQALDKFSSIKIQQGLTLNEIYSVSGPKQLVKEETQIHVVTIQGLMRKVLDPKYNSNLNIDTYDCIIVDECHRGYFLDKEMDEDEIQFGNHLDYFSAYKKCINYFDAVKIGITATPALHTAEIFGKPIYTYTYSEGVLDGWIVDHESPYKVYTELNTKGIKWKKGDHVEFLSNKNAKTKIKILKDELNYKSTDFNKKVITRKFNKVISEILCKHIDPRKNEKSLFFASSDNHADILVNELKIAFSNEYGQLHDDVISKVTGSIDRPGEMIKKFQYEKYPNIAVTVDLLTTGIDIPEICNLIFVRNVNSRILYEQMLGRATRLCPELNKEFFKIYDCVGICEKIKDFTNILPVSKSPKTKIKDLAEKIIDSKNSTEFNFFKNEILKKINIKKRYFSEKTNTAIIQKFKKNIDDIINDIRHSTKVSDFKTDIKNLVKIIDENSVENFIPISTHEDKLIKVEQSISNPKDYLMDFKSFIFKNKNKVNALKLLSTAPQKLKRNDIREIYFLFLENGFKEKEIQECHKKLSGSDISARIIGFIRQASIGDPLIDYKKRVEAAIKKILITKTWTEEQKKWLKRFGQQILKDHTFDIDMFNEGAYQNSGGFDRLDNMFENKLTKVLDQIKINIWKAS